MSVKAKAPKEDPETKLRRELAEQRAEAGRIEELGADVSEDTRSIIRRFGRISGSSTSGLGAFGPGSGGSFANNFGRQFNTGGSGPRSLANFNLR